MLVSLRLPYSKRRVSCCPTGTRGSGRRAETDQGTQWTNYEVLLAGTWVSLSVVSLESSLFNGFVSELLTSRDRPGPQGEGEAAAVLRRAARRLPSKGVSLTKELRREARRVAEFCSGSVKE